MQHTKFPFRLPNKIELLYLGEFTDEVLSRALSNKFFSRSTLRIYIYSWAPSRGSVDSFARTLVDLS